MLAVWHSHIFIFASNIVNVFPLISTLSLFNLTFKCPVLFDNCNESNSVFPSFSAYNGVNAQCAEPVTGSSFIPAIGAKHLTTKLACFELLFEVIICNLSPSLFLHNR